MWNIDKSTWGKQPMYISNFEGTKIKFPSKLIIPSSACYSSELRNATTIY